MKSGRILKGRCRVFRTFWLCWEVVGSIFSKDEYGRMDAFHPTPSQWERMAKG
jgi:hypothetical protein